MHTLLLLYPLDPDDSTTCTPYSIPKGHLLTHYKLNLHLVPHGHCLADKQDFLLPITALRRRRRGPRRSWPSVLAR